MCTDNVTLREGFDITHSAIWSGRRCSAKMKSIASSWCDVYGNKPMHDITTQDVLDFVRQRVANGDAPRTVSARLAALRSVSDFCICTVPQLIEKPLPRVPAPRVNPSPAWWLEPSKREEIRPKLPYTLAQLVDIICETGLRVEEALRVRPEHVERRADGPWLRVPGTKTKGSAVCIPISITAESLIASWGGIHGGYTKAMRMWRTSRVALGLPEEATLRGLRRSFAATKHMQGMPTEMLRRIMRHTDISTTVGYLQLLGFDGVEGCRAYL